MIDVEPKVLTGLTSNGQSMNTEQQMCFISQTFVWANYFAISIAVLEIDIEILL